MKKQQSTAQLAIAWQAGNLRSGGQLLEQFRPTLERFFLTKISDKDGRAVIIDLVQETMCRASMSIGNYAHRGEFRGFLYRIAYRVFCDWLDAKLRRQGHIDEQPHADEGIDAFMIHGDMSSARDDQTQALRMALRNLPKEDQAIIELHYFDELPYEEVIEVLNLSCSNQALRNRVHRIKIKLRKMLGTDDGGTMSDVGISRPELSLGRQLRALGELILAVLTKFRIAGHQNC